MVTRRTPIDPIQGPRAAAPAAQPVNTYFGVPNLPAPVFTQLLDLSPLSASVDRMVRAFTPEVRQQQIGAAKSFYAENKDAIMSAAKTGDVEAIVAKQLQGAESPLFYKSLYEQAGESLASLYATELQKTLTTFEAVQDDKGLPAGPAATPEQYQESLTKKTLEHPLMANFYARTAFADAKARIDEEYAARAVLTQAKAQEEYDRQAKAAAISADLEGQITALDPAKEQEFAASLQTRLEETYKVYGGQQARAMFWFAAEGSVREALATDPQKAKEMMDVVLNTKVGGALLGDDPRYQAQAAELRRIVIRAEEEDRRDTGRKLAEQKAETDLKFLRDVEPVLNEAWKRGGTDLLLAAERLREQAPTQFGEWAPYAMQKIDETVRAFQAKTPSDPGALEDVMRMASTTPEAAEAYLNAAITTGTIVGRDIEAVRTAIAKGKDLTPWLSRQDYTSLLRTVEDLKPRNPGMSAEAQLAQQQVFETTQAQIQQDYLAFVAAHKLEPDKVTDWLANKKAEVSKQLQQNSLESAKQANQVTQQILEGLNRGKNVEALIDAARVAGTITVEQASQWQRTNAEAVKFDRYLRGPDMADLEASVTKRIAQLDRAGGDGMGLGDEFEEARREFIKTERTTLAQQAEEGKLSVIEMEAGFRERLEQFGKGLRPMLDKYTKQQAEQEDAAAEADSAEATGRALNLWATNSGDNWFGPDELPKGVVDPNVEKIRWLTGSAQNVQGRRRSESFYAAYEDAVFQARAGRPVGEDATRVQRMKQNAAATVSALIGDELLDEGAKVKGVSSVLGLVGVTPELMLDGQVTINGINYPLDKALVNPLTTPMFGSKDEFRRYVEANPEWEASVMRKYGMNPDQPTDIGRFRNLQQLAIRRLNPNG